MKKLIAPILAFICCSIAAGSLEAGATAVESTRVDDIVSLDGSASEWAGMPITYLQESLHVMVVAHDDHAVYLMFSFSDRRLAQDILRRGVLLWFNGNGKTKKKNERFALRYNGSTQIADHFSSALDDEDGSDPGTGGARSSGRSGRGMPPPESGGLRNQPGQLTIIRMGLKETVPEDNPTGPVAASKVIDDIFCYELRVSLSDIGGKAATQSPKSKRRVAIGIQIGGMTEAEMEMIQIAMKERISDVGGSPQGGMGGMGGMGGGRPGGMGGGRPGGMSGGMGGGRGGEGRPDLDPDIHWLSVTLVPAADDPPDDFS